MSKYIILLSLLLGPTSNLQLERPPGFKNFQNRNWTKGVQVPQNTRNTHQKNFGRSSNCGNCVFPFVYSNRYHYPQLQQSNR